MEKTFYPGKIMYSGFNGTVKPVQFLRHHESEVDIYYARLCYRGESGVEFGGEYKLIGLNYLFDTREEAINFALSELSASIAKLPSIDELRDLEMSAQPNTENSPNLKQLAEKAKQMSHGAAKWIAVDKDGEVNAFNLKPLVDQYSKDSWCAFDPYSGLCLGIGQIKPPADFRIECYEISKILSE